MYYHRQLEKTVLKAADEFACVTLYGARQTGKSTMVRTMFENIEYDLINKDDRQIGSIHDRLKDAQRKAAEQPKSTRGDTARRDKESR